MTSSKQDTSEVTEALQSLSEAVVKLQASYAATQRTNFLLKIAMTVLLIILVAGIYIGMKQAIQPVNNMLGQIAHRMHVSSDPEADALRRKELFEQLTPEQKTYVERFERNQRWIADYIRANPEFDPGAAIALFLSEMSISIRVMPGMYAEMSEMKQEVRAMTQEVTRLNGEVKTMNAKMNALPVLATEVQGLHRQVIFIADDLDSTMGQAGRIFPW